MTVDIKKIVEAFAKDYSEVFEKMTNIHIDNTQTKEKTHDNTINQYKSAILIAYQNSNRKINGKFMLGFKDEKMAVKLAAAIAKTIGISPIEQLDGTALDILSEFMNTVAGQAITSWDQLGLSAEFGTPKLATDVSLDESNDAHTSIYEVILDFNGDSVAMLVHIVESGISPQAGKKVLVVDDSMIIRFMLTKSFKERGWQVLEAKDGLEALLKFKQYSADLIIMDLVMPQMGGLKSISLIREFDPKVDIIILTSTAKKEDVITAASYKVKGYIKKPIQMEQLMEIASGSYSLNSCNIC